MAAGGRQVAQPRSKEIHMLPPIALQTYTLREALASDYASVMRKVAQIGYVGVEVCENPGMSNEKAGRLIRELGLEVPSSHFGLPIGDRKQAVLDGVAAFGAPCIVPSTDSQALKTLDGIKAVCERFNEGNAVCMANGLKLGLHNHWWEFGQLDGRYVLDIMLDFLEPSIFVQVDTYWVKAAGADPVAVVKRLGARVPLLHIKDGPATKEAPMLAAGSGVMDFPAIAAAAAGNCQWMIIEMDRCATDMMEAVEQSYRYMVGAGLARGKS
jgi:sugar phosphate isomerase/epimerase